MIRIACGKFCALNNAIDSCLSKTHMTISIMCPEYSELSMPACVRALRNLVTNLFFVSGERNKRPGALPWAARYTRRAVTGHRSFPLCPM